MALFACSFDAASPFSPYTVATNLTTATGRNGNCARLATGSVLTASAAFGPSCTVGLAYKTTAFTNTICALTNTTTGGLAGGVADLANYGDGRLQLRVGSGIGATTYALTSGFTYNIGVWVYLEMEAALSQLVVPVTSSTSDLTITVSANVYANNNLVGSGSDIHTIFGIANVNIPSGTFTQLAHTPPGGGAACYIDDVYVDYGRIGDCHVMSDDTTVSVETTKPDLSQSVIEVGVTSVTVSPRLDQSPIEVGLQPLGILFPSCPSTNTMFIGIPYTGTLIVTGGNGTYGFTVLS